jgi:hypothetical protein
VPYQFGDFVFDPARHELRCGARLVHLAPKAFQLLTLLVEERSRVVSKEEIHRRLWPGRTPSESSLARVTSELRAALGDEAGQPRFVRTVHGSGYAFVGTDTDPPPRPKGVCRLAWGNRRIRLAEGPNTIGRAQNAVVTIDSGRVSRQHARITVTMGRAVLEDLGSKNGTFVGTRRIDAPTELQDGDEIGVGPVCLRFESRGSDFDTTETG